MRKEKGVLVKFNDSAEFRAELEATIPNVDGVLRLTRKVVTNPSSPCLYAICVLGSYLHKQGDVIQIIELEEFCGDRFRDDKDSRAMVRSEAILKTLTQVGTLHGYQVRSGHYEHA